MNSFIIPPQNQLIEVGRVHSPQGVKGQIYVAILAREAAWQKKWQNLIIKDKENNFSSFEIVQKKVHEKQGKWGFVIGLKSVTDRNFVEALKGVSVYVPVSFFVSREDEPVYLRELLEFRVIDKRLGDVGPVIGISSNGPQDLLVIAGKNGEFEVPYVRPLLINTNRKDKSIDMDIPEGLVP